jgi:vacuolar-type H+-ATPase subunit E/Vma4
MSEKEFLKALEDDTRRECAVMLEKAQKEAAVIIKAAEEEQERFNRERVKKTVSDMEIKRIKMLANAKLYANEALLKERQLAVNRVLEIVSDRFKELRKAKEYQKILEGLLKEVLDGFKDLIPLDKEYVVMVSKQDLPLLKGFNNVSRCEIIAGETDNVSTGVFLMSKDKKYTVVNTLDSRLEKARPELVSIIDRMLFKDSC